MNPELENLIELALVDDVVTEKEKQVLYKKAKELGVDIDEFEMILESKIQLANKSKISTSDSSKNKSQKIGNIKKCPACGATVSSFEIKCGSCSHEFRDVKVNESLDTLFKELKSVKQKKNEYGEIDSSDFYEKRARIIRDFPMPTSKEILLELITRGIAELNMIDTESIYDLLKSSVNEPEVQAWQSKTEEALDKLRIVSLNDNSLTPMISDFEKKLNRKLKSRKAKITMKKSGLTLKYVGIGIVMIPGLIFCYYFYKWIGELLGLF
tara:strand:+ start:246 stop:1049 length:804 start_codon:yes stop_codon:yes gene_type:complete